MRKIKIKKTNSAAAKMFKAVSTLFLLLIMPSILFSSQMDENLVDDVTAMITNAKKLAHTTYLLDTSENMNTFAYSDYLNTCSDAETNIAHAIYLCMNAYNQCRTVESNASCNPNLNCPDILVKCNNLRASENRLKTFCNKVKVVYAEPPKKTAYGWDNALSKKFVGPWNPNDNTYELDLCFYNWHKDTGGEVLEGTTSGHFSNLGAGQTDRRDWDCMTDGTTLPDNRGGVWLNWKYSTSLDAVKIIMADEHEFSFTPRTRGKRECQMSNYLPFKDDPVVGRICYQDFDTVRSGPTAIDDMIKIKNEARNNWTKIIDDTCDGAGCAGKCSGDTFTHEIDTTDPGYVGSPLSSAQNCDICKNFAGEEVPCRQYMVAITKTNELATISGVNARVDYDCCSNYQCDDMKCRDDDLTCRSEVAKPCILGYYSDFDQDQNHCCTNLKCVEKNDPLGCASGGGQFSPGPGNYATSDELKHITTLSMLPLAGSDQYQNVTLTAKVSSLTFTIPENVSKAIVTLLYGCNVAGEVPSEKMAEKEYSAPVVAPGDHIIAAPFELSGCETTGYNVNAVLQVFHVGGTNFSEADVTLDVDFTFNYTSGSEQDIEVLDKDLIYYYEYINMTAGDPTDRVNEYECKTTFFTKQSLVISGKPSKCPPKHPDHAYCVFPDHEVIAKDSWGKVKKSACSWLCKDQDVYDDVWKCRAFFSQMDNPLRGGSNKCMTVCPDGTGPLDECCQCINLQQSIYNYRELEPPQTVRFNPVPSNPAFMPTCPGGVCKCAVSGFEEGVTSDGKRTYTSAFMSEVITGHIKELPDGTSYRLFEATNEDVSGDALFNSPYSLPTNHWYASQSLISRSNSFLRDSFSTVFKTGLANSRDIACVYDLLDNFEGEDCDDCGTGCCSISIGGGTDYCNYPNFWMKIPNTEGGQLLFEAKTLTGGDLTTFRNKIKTLKALGGSTLGETVYDIWRYLGGMYAIHDPQYKTATGIQFPSPFQGAPAECFVNEVVVISGGQPQFDDNRVIMGAGAPATAPFVRNGDPALGFYDATDVATGFRPYVRSNWHVTSFPQAVSWIHTKDFWHDDPLCRKDNAVNIWGYEVGGTSVDGATCNPSTDPSGTNIVDRVHAVAIGEWALAPLYNNPGNTYLEESVLQTVTTVANGQGTYFGLTAETPNAPPSDPVKTFSNLTDMFNAFQEVGSEDDRAAGRPHWTSSLVQPLDTEEKVRGPEAYSPVTIPIDNKVSRFWFGNLKKYTIDDGSSGCNFKVEGGGDNTDIDLSGWTKKEIPAVDCFYPSDTGADITDSRFALLNAGGAAKVLEDALLAKPAGCDATYASEVPCYMSGARNVLYDDGSDILDLKTANPLSFAGWFGKTKLEAIKILDYMYGYDSFNDDLIGGVNHVRFIHEPTIEVDDPFDIKFDSSNKTTIRKLLLGAITHSEPLAVYYETMALGTVTRIFAGANDGMLHSFDGSGNETFAYIPKPVLPAMTALLNPLEGIFFNAGVDGPVTLLHIDKTNDGMINENEKAYLVFGYRRGGGAYTILDVSEVDNPKLVQHIYLETDGSKRAKSFGKVTVFRKCPGAECRYADELDYYLAVPGGYDTCHDTDVPVCSLNGSGHIDPLGNEIMIFKLNASGSFDLTKKYDMYTPGNDPLVRDAGWMRSSFASKPIAINTKDRLALDTEFVYFVDMSSSVFRIDVREKNPADWKFRAVFVQRAAPQPIAWGTGLRVYNGSNFFPPLMKHPTYGAGNNIIPLPVLTGNAANPRISEIDEMMMVYDKYDFNFYHDPLLSNVMKDVQTDQGGNGTAPWAGVNGWKYAFLDPVTEKGVSAPLVFYDMFQTNEHTVLWNTYVPNELTDCKNFGTSRSYQKALIDGENVLDRWDPVYQHGTDEISIATSIGVVQTSEGYSFTFGSGHEIFMREAAVVNPNITNIIKWYELY